MTTFYRRPVQKNSETVQDVLSEQDGLSEQNALSEQDALSEQESMDASSVQELLTHATECRAYRMCRCAICSSVSRCTPSNDFYTIADPDQHGPSAIDYGKPLLCGGCFYTHVANRSTAS